MGIHSDQTTQVKKGRIVKRIVNSYDSTVSSGGTYSNHEYAPPPGKLWKLKGLYLEAPAPGGTSGTHFFVVNGGAKPHYLRGESNYDTKVKFQYNEWTSADVVKRPGSGLPTALTNIRIVQNPNLRVQYWNGTDADQTGTRYVYFVVVEEPL